MEVTMRTADRIACFGILFALGAGCGASSSGSSGARAAEVSQYSCNVDEMIAAAQQAVAKEFYKVEKTSKEPPVVVSEARWYSKEGAPRRAGASSAELTDGDIAFAARVRMNDLKPNFQIRLDAAVQQYVAGSPKARDLPEGDPQRPAWIQARLDKAAADMHSRLQSCAALVREPH
jgi:hypothetical protein